MNLMDIAVEMVLLSAYLFVPLSTRSIGKKEVIVLEVFDLGGMAKLTKNGV